jgi:tyrosine-protein kinase Etk/Wzc
MDWERIVALLWARKWLIFGVTLLATVAAIFAVRALVPPVYQTRSTIWLDETESKVGAITAQDVLEGTGWAGLMRSYAVLEPIARRRKLFVKPLRPSRLDRAAFSAMEVTDSVIPSTYQLFLESGRYRLVNKETGEIETGRVGDAIGNSANFSWQPTASQLDGLERIEFDLTSSRAAALELRGQLDTYYDAAASLIYANIFWDDPQEAAEILNTTVEGFIETATELKNHKLAEIVGILEAQTEFAAAQLQGKELELERFRVETATEPTNMQAVPLPGANLTRGTVFDAYFEQRLEARRIESDAGQLEGLLSEVRAGRQLDDLTLALIPAVQTDAELRAALGELTDKEASRRALLYTYTAQHPDVVDLTGEIDMLQQQSIPNMIGALIQQLEDRRTLLDEQMTAQASELRQVPARAIEDTRREREFRLSEELHGRLLTQLREATLAAATSLPDLQVVDRAFPPFAPSNNEAPRIIFMVAMASLGLTIGGVVLRDRMDKRIYSPDEITSRLGLPVLGIVPRLNDARTRDSSQAAVAIESFRAIRTQIAHAGPSEGQLVLITSAAPRDGKSMVSANLAISYASSGKRTLLLDADTRRGRAEQMFGLGASPGLSDYLLERADLEDVEQQTEVDNLTFLARGDHSGFSAELLGSQRMADLLAELRGAYDAVVIDAPPLAAGADTLFLGELSDKVVMVFRAGETDHKMARTKLDMIGNVELPFVGAVLNAVPEKAHYYDYYANYYYADKVG